MNRFKHLFPVEKMAQVFKVSKSSYYYWQGQRVGKWEQINEPIIRQIRTIHAKSKQTYGSPRISQELRKQGYLVSQPRVGRLMKQAGIRSILRKKYVRTTDSAATMRRFENLLDRNFTPGHPGRVWVSDITYIATQQGWSYLTTIIDLGDRNVIGWRLSPTLRACDTIIPVWKAAVATRPITGPLIFHSDQGVQYGCDALIAEVSKDKRVTQSMSRKGDCWDNAVAESFFKTLKCEWTNRFTYRDHKQAELSVFEYIESFYNTKRAHSSLGYLSPVEYAAKQLTKTNAA